MDKKHEHDKHMRHDHHPMDDGLEIKNKKTLLINVILVFTSCLMHSMVAKGYGIFL